MLKLEDINKNAALAGLEPGQVVRIATTEPVGDMQNQCVVYAWRDSRSVDIQDAQRVARGLARENLRSVATRYQNDLDGQRPGPGLLDAEIIEAAALYAAHFLQHPQRLKPVQVIRLCEGLDYQCCETDVWKETLAYRQVEWIKSAAIRKLPGYELAQWEYTQPIPAIEALYQGGCSMSAPRTVGLKDALPILALSQHVRRRLREEFGNAGQRAMLKKMRERDIEDEAGAEAHDFLLDEIGNEGTIVWDGVIPARDDEYPVHIKHYGGVYLVWAMEYDDEGYFLCFEHAWDYVDDNWPLAIEVSDESPTPRKRKIEREKADAYLQDLADEKANRVRWEAPPQPEAFAWWIERIQQPLPEAIDSRIALMERWLAEPEKPYWRSHGYMATTYMPILIRLLGDEAATEALLRGLKEKRPKLAAELVALVTKTGKRAA